LTGLIKGKADGRRQTAEMKRQWAVVKGQRAEGRDPRRGHWQSKSRKAVLRFRLSIRLLRPLAWAYLYYLL